ncbi:prepilin-type N-terminal cleavage/methylation domain-containing protein [uncultured Amphritea sp.]|uniref:prepilin-type N-terminal cleavage/methylation domain-containing protein n=1 Tax=uncultured Amphritea sp. TaxID=981605 RepID=UPI002604E775|nr:prepilin-type N-terminal cleavage/methylation domain-containing protein [uncultured Amphritea sp.]
MQPHSQQQTGFTLLELLVVMAIAGMLLALVVPRFGSAFSGAQFQKQVHDLTTTLNQARNTASATGQLVRLELSTTDRSLVNATGEILFSWPEDSELMFVNSDHQPLETGYLLFIPDAGSNGAILQLTRQDKKTEFSINWLTGGVSHETL